MASMISSATALPRIARIEQPDRSLGRSAPLALLIMDILVKPHTDIDRSTLREFVGVQLNKTPLPGVPKEGFGAPERSGFLICVIRGKAVAELVAQKDSSA